MAAVALSLLSMFGLSIPASASAAPTNRLREAPISTGYPVALNLSNAVISGQVVAAVDCGSHTLFIAQVTEARTQNDLPSATYAYYFAHIKPKPQPQAPAPENKQLHHWVCRICGYVYEGETLPPDYV